MSDAKLVNIARLMTTYNFEIEQLPDNLKCAECKLVLKNACRVPCGCSFCRVCIDDMMMRGGEFCPGNSKDCGKSSLSRLTVDYRANKNISRLAVECPHDGCVYRCQLVNMEEHLRECPRKGEECPYRELGCTQDKLAAEEMGRHLQHDKRRHSEILIGKIANINKEIETLKHELVLKDGQIRSIVGQMIHLQNENKSIKNDINSIKEEKEDLVDQMGILSEEIEREIAERRENDELTSVRVIDHVDREIAATTRLIESNKDELVKEIQSVRCLIESIKQDVQSLKDNLQVQPLQSKADEITFKFDWLLQWDISVIRWLRGGARSEFFFGAVHPYKCRLVAGNFNGYGGAVHLHLDLEINPGPNDWQLSWPFEARVAITVTDRRNDDASISICKQCRIERPPAQSYSSSNPFDFRHSKMRKAGLNLDHGVRVSCVIVHGAGH